jgi:hypothetical protein
MSDSLIDPSGGDPAPADPISADPATPPADFSFYGDEGIRPELNNLIGENKAVASYFQKYAGAEDPNKAAIEGIGHLSQLASQKERTRPADDASDADKQVWNDYIRNQLGVPEKPEGYGWEKPEDIGDDMWNQEEMGTFADILHKGNVSPETAKELFDAYTGGLRNAPEQIEAQVAQQLAVERDKLNAEYGMEADKMIAHATEAANLLGVSPEEAQRIGQTAEGIKLLARMKNTVTGDVTSNTQSTNGMTNGGSSNYEEQAMGAGLKAVEAHNRGDMASYKKFSEQQSHYNQLHANASR